MLQFVMAVHDEIKERLFDVRGVGTDAMPPAVAAMEAIMNEVGETYFRNEIVPCVANYLIKVVHEGRDVLIEEIELQWWLDETVVATQRSWFKAVKYGLDLIDWAHFHVSGEFIKPAAMAEAIIIRIRMQQSNS